MCACCIMERLICIYMYVGGHHHFMYMHQILKCSRQGRTASVASLTHCRSTIRCTCILESRRYMHRSAFFVSIDICAWARETYHMRVKISTYSCWIEQSRLAHLLAATHVDCYFCWPLFFAYFLEYEVCPSSTAHLSFSLIPHDAS